MVLRVLIKVAWGFLGSLSFMGGIIGLLLPVIPQVPFFLVTIFCIAKISPRFHKWLLSNRLYLKYLAPIIAKFRLKRVVKS
ncbi:DUF454 family protein [Limosilactobacillus caccae]|uniref:DUF454 family protein n=1 Tax=Limosilactobacillus caccae TaxID=1926284 RepID=UPI0009709E48|nr:DUF454 family protein [Limosilactobacillus caccae]